MENFGINNGWVKVHRRLTRKGFYRNSQYVHLWVHLLLIANHEPKEFMWNQNIMIVKGGQMITSRDKLSEATGIHRSSVERILNFLENEHQIEQKKTTKYRLVTILNWKTYQQDDRKLSNRRATTEQQASTNKNDKNYKNEKKDIAEASSAGFSLSEEIKKMEENKRRDINIIALYFDQRKPDLRTKEQFEKALRRHLRDAKDLSPFTDDQILAAIPKAKKLTPDWTVGTLVKVLTK